MAHSLANKSAIVTGAAGGLGKAMVTIVDINQERLDSASSELSAHGEVHAVQADITKEESVKKIFEAAKSKFGDVDILVNNAGIMDKFEPVGDLDKELWDKVIAVNLSAPMLASKYAVGAMEKKGSGVILNVGSMAGAHGFRAGEFTRDIDICNLDILDLPYSRGGLHCE